MPMFTTAIILLFIFLVIGIPVSFSMILSGLGAALITGGMDFWLVARNLFSGLDSFPLMACPFFILAGDLMTSGGISRKIISFTRSILGFIPGGTAVTTVGGSMIFAAISGSAAATTAAMGSITVPDMLEEGYKKGFCASLIACAGAIGPIIPPSINMIVYCSVTGDSISKMFMCGLVPGIMCGIGLMLYSIWYARHDRIPRVKWEGIKNYFLGILKSLKSSIWALFAPIIIMGGIFSGIFTATEAGIVACVYSIFCGVFIYRNLTLKKVIQCLGNTVVLCGMVMLIMSSAKIYAYIFTVERVGEAISALLLGITNNPYIILLIVFGIMLIMGMFLEMLAVLIVMIPVIYPLFTSLGKNPYHFGVVLCIASVYGSLTPPVGIQVFVSQGMLGIKMKEMLRHLYPMVLIMVIVVVICIFMPNVVTIFLP